MKGFVMIRYSKRTLKSWDSAVKKPHIFKAPDGWCCKTAAAYRINKDAIAFCKRLNKEAAK